MKELTACVEKIKVFFPFSPEEKDFLARIPEVLPLQEIWNEVYRFARSTEEGRRILADFDTPESREDLAKRGQAFFRQAFREFDRPSFIEKAREVARLHLEKGVEPSLFMGALEHMKTRFYKEAQARLKTPCSMAATLSRFFSLLATLILQEYHRLQQESLRRSAEENRRKAGFLETLREINLLIFYENTSEKALLAEACRILAQRRDLPLVWGGLLTPEGRLRPLAAFPEDHPYLRELDLSVEDLRSKGVTPYLERFFQGTPIIIDDLKTDPLYGFRWEVLKRYGLRSIAVIPLFLDEKIAGALFLYHSEPNHFLADEVHLLAEVGRDLSLGLRYIRQARRLEETLYRDNLTGLNNERYFLSVLPSILLSAQKEGKRCAVIRIDIVDFSHINAHLGYQGGDRVLKETARRLLEVFGPTVLLARTGADEFAVAYVFGELDELHRKIERLDRRLRESFLVDGERLRVAFGMGIALYPEDAQTSEELYERASIALRRVYRQAEGGTSFYVRPEQGVITRLKLLGEIEEALKRGEFHLYFQPQISLETRRPVAFEGLLRWIHPERGLVPPGEFISVLEESDLMVEVGWLVVELALKFLREARKIEPDLRVSVNVSLRQLREPDFRNELEKRLRGLGFHYPDLELEITERILMDDKAVDLIQRLLARKARFALDDFGTGYASFRSLQQLPRVDLKIDRSFIREVPDRREQVALVTSMVSMARALSRRTVAEGVETREQLAFLTGLGVDAVQGYHFAPPLPPEEALEFLRTYDQEKYFWKRTER